MQQNPVQQDAFKVLGYIAFMRIYGLWNSNRYAESDRAQKFLIRIGPRFGRSESGN